MIQDASSWWLSCAGGRFERLQQASAEPESFSSRHSFSTQFTRVLEFTAQSLEDVQASFVAQRAEGNFCSGDGMPWRQQFEPIPC